MNFIAVHDLHGIHLVNIDYIEDVVEDVDGVCTIYLGFICPSAAEQDYIVPNESFAAVRQMIADAQCNTSKHCELCKDGRTMLGATHSMENDGKWHKLNYCSNCGAKLEV